jgi:ADP-heptose:LPS heptosyltransferase
MHQFSRTYVLPFKYPIPNYIDIYLQKVKIYKRVIKFYRRCFYIFLKGQHNLEIFKILPKHQKILWINLSAPSLGDSLMDLSSRILLNNRKVDLFTDKKNSHIYEDDLYFNNIFSNIKDINSKYDLVILDSYSSRTLKIKHKVASKTNFVGIYGYFNGPEVNRILFSFHQMNNLLGYINTEKTINKIAKNSISISKKDQNLVAKIIPIKYIAISLGGEWKYKTFRKWDKVIQLILQENKELNIVLVGSKNATFHAMQILNKFPNDSILNFTSRLSFKQTAEVINKAEVFLCCDGGLMHAASGLNSNLVTLFAKLTPQMLLTSNTPSYCLFDKDDVNNIEVNKILAYFFQALNIK